MTHYGDLPLAELIALVPKDDQKLLLKLVRSDGSLLRHIDFSKQNEDICIAAIEKSAYMIEFVDYNAVYYNEMCLSAIHQNCYAISKIKNKTYAMCLESVKGGYSLKYI